MNAHIYSHIHAHNILACMYLNTVSGQNFFAPPSISHKNPC